MRQRRRDVRKLERLREAAALGFAEIERGNYVQLGIDEFGAYLSAMREEVSARRRNRRNGGKLVREPSSRARSPAQEE
jgi:hypothetical protein